jgi:hypothetical protein
MLRHTSKILATAAAVVAIGTAACSDVTNDRAARRRPGWPPPWPAARRR